MMNATTTATADELAVVLGRNHAVRAVGFDGDVLVVTLEKSTPGYGMVDLVKTVADAGFVVDRHETTFGKTRLFVEAR